MEIKFDANSENVPPQPAQHLTLLKRRAEAQVERVLPLPGDFFLNPLSLHCGKRMVVELSDGKNHFYVRDGRIRGGPGGVVGILTENVDAGMDVGVHLRNERRDKFLQGTLDPSVVQGNIEYYLTVVLNAHVNVHNGDVARSRRFLACPGEEPNVTVILDRRRLQCGQDVVVARITRQDLIDPNFDPVSAVEFEIWAIEKAITELTAGAPYTGDGWRDRLTGVGPTSRRRWLVTPCVDLHEYEVIDIMTGAIYRIGRLRATDQHFHLGQWLQDIAAARYCHRECVEAAEEAEDDEDEEHYSCEYFLESSITLLWRND